MVGGGAIHALLEMGVVFLTSHHCLVGVGFGDAPLFFLSYHMIWQIGIDLFSLFQSRGLLLQDWAGLLVGRAPVKAVVHLHLGVRQLGRQTERGAPVPNV